MSRSRPWYAEGLRFQCQPACTRCCGGAPGDVWVTPDEQRALAERLALSLEAFNRAYVRRTAEGDSLKEKENDDCILLNAHGCTVYPARPRQCRTFPFWEENLASARDWERLKEECPGVGVGRRWTFEEIEQARRGMAPVHGR